MAWSKTPRARDVFDLWFILVHGGRDLDRTITIETAKAVAQEKHLQLQADLDAKYAAILANAWDKSLERVRPHPSFITARSEIEQILLNLLP